VSGHRMGVPSAHGGPGCAWDVRCESPDQRAYYVHGQPSIIDCGVRVLVSVARLLLSADGHSKKATMPAVSLSSWPARRPRRRASEISLPKLLPSQPSWIRVSWSGVGDGVVRLSVLDFLQRLTEGGLCRFEAARSIRAGSIVAL
jgi:hypothetical protein